MPGRPDTFVALTLLASLGIAAATGAVGMSPALGALLAGLLLAETEFRHEIESTLEPFKGLLMGLFFMSVGMTLDLSAVWREPAWIAGAVLALFALKAALLAPILRAAGLPAALSVESALLLGQGGEFGFVMLGAAAAAGVIAPELERSIALIVGASLFAAPLAAALGERLGASIARRGAPGPGSATVPDVGAGGAAARSTAEVPAGDRGVGTIPDDLAATVEPPPVEGRVVVIGHGRVGWLIGDVLERERIDWMAVETDPCAIAADHASGRPVVYGDATRPELLRRLGVDRAAALVVTVRRESTAIAAVEVARREAPRLTILVRARDEREARRLRAAGADAAIPETLECALRLAEGTLGALGLPDEHVDRIVALERDRRIARLDADRPAGVG